MLIGEVWADCETKVKSSSVSRCDAYYKKVKEEIEDSTANVKHIVNKISEWVVEHKHVIGIIVLAVCLILFWPFLVGRAVIREIRKVIQFPF